MKFLGGVYVFPGGAVHESDYSPLSLGRCRGLSPAEARSLLGNSHSEELALGHWVAAIRELFEEVGVLLCINEQGGTVKLEDAESRRRFEAKRREIVRERLGFADFLSEEGLYCDLSRAHYFFHRVTPEFYSIRFDARFYLALLPPGQAPLATSEEVAESLWLAPADALSRACSRDFPILPPTTTVLEHLSQLGSWERLCELFQLH